MLTRGQVAVRLVLTRDGVKKVDHHLQPIQDAEGQWWYDIRQVDAYRLHLDARRGNAELPTHFQSPLATRAFELFENGRSRADVVIALSLHPAAVKRLWEDWTEMSEEGAKEKHRLHVAEINRQAEAARVKADGYRDYNEFRIRQQELQLAIATEYRKTAQYRGEVSGAERLRRQPLPGSSLPRAAGPKLPEK